MSVDTEEGCRKAGSGLGVENTDLFVEETPSMPKGCFVYRSNKLYFNQHPTGLDKGRWSDDTRKVCRDFEISMETAGGRFKRIVY